MRDDGLSGGRPPVTLYTRWGKRALDLVGSAILLIVLAPAMLVTGVLTRMFIGRPVLFRQPRAGLRGREFTIYKLRTMRDGLGPDGRLLDDGQRITRLGERLRASSLDELPTLWNVFKGDMSLVGPRPLLMMYLPRYTAQQARRHLVRPGITGLSQVNGRNSSTWEQRLLQDEWYVDHLSLRMDLSIILTTLARVVQRKGISAAGHATMPEFLGTTGRMAGGGAAVEGDKSG